MADLNAPMRQCQAKNSEGKPCTAPPSSSNDYCFWHDPAKEEERRLARSRGGMSGRPRTLSPDAPDPSLRSPKEVVELMECTSGAVLRGELSPQLANASAYAATVALKAMEIELNDRLDRLERRVKAEANLNL
jgi:hypothetical protein